MTNLYFCTPSLSCAFGVDAMEACHFTPVYIGVSQVSKVVYSKQPKLGLTQEFVVDCAHALWVVHSIKRLVSLMLLKWFLSDSFIYFMYRMFKEKF